MKNKAELTVDLRIAGAETREDISVRLFGRGRVSFDVFKWSISDVVLRDPCRKLQVMLDLERQGAESRLTLALPGTAVAVT